MPKVLPTKNRYQVLIEKVFFDHYKAGTRRFCLSARSSFPQPKS